MQKQILLKLSKISDVSQGKGYLLCCSGLKLIVWKVKKGWFVPRPRLFWDIVHKKMRVGSSLNQKTGGELV